MVLTGPYMPHSQLFAATRISSCARRSRPTAFNRRRCAPYWNVDPDQFVFAMQPMTAYVSNAIWQQRLSGRLFGVFAVLALALAVSGLYRVMAQLVGQRTREIGLRMALGASRTDVKRVLLSESTQLMLAGSANGVMLNVTTLAAAYIPARRAAALRPMSALRES
jgi:ABC-type lipoprotein release transport system permease subunit